MGKINDILLHSLILYYARFIPLIPSMSQYWYYLRGENFKTFEHSNLTGLSFSLEVIVVAYYKIRVHATNKLGSSYPLFFTYFAAGRFTAVFSFVTNTQLIRQDPHVCQQTLQLLMDVHHPVGSSHCRYFYILMLDSSYNLS